MIELVYFIPIFLIAFCLGKKILSLLRIKCYFVEEFVFSVGLGYLVLSMVVFVLGILGLYYSWIFYLLFLLLSIVFFKNMLNLVVTTPKKIISFYKELTLIEKSLFYLISSMFIINLLGTLSPPFGIDVVIYQLAVPKLYILQHKMHYLPTICLSNTPMALNMLFLIGLIIKNGILAKLFAYSFGIILALSLYAFCRRFLTKTAGLFAAMILYTLPIVVEYTVQAYVDIGTALFTLLAVYLFILWRNKAKEKKYLICSALFAGFATISKMNGAAIIITLGIMILSDAFIKKDSFKNTIIYLLVFGGVSGIISIPWFLKTFIYTGNPVFPYFYNLFGGANWNAVIEAKKNLLFGAKYPNKSILYFLLLPFIISFKSSSHGAFLGWGPIFLAFIPLLLIFKKNKETIKQLLVVSLVMLVIWYTMPVQSIRVLFIYPMLSIVAGFVVGELLKQGLLLKRITLLLIFSTFFFGVALAGGIRYKTGQVHYSLNLISEKEFYNNLKDDYGIYGAFSYINENLPKEAKLFFFRNLRGYLSDRDYIVGGPIGQGYIDYSAMTSSQELLLRLKAEKITHIVMDTGIYGAKYINEHYYDKHTMQLMDGVIKDHSKLVFKKEGAYVYEIVDNTY